MFFLQNIIKDTVSDGKVGDFQLSQNDMTLTGTNTRTRQSNISDRQNKEHIRENRTKNRTNNRQNRILQKTPNILLFIRLELYRITRPNSFVFILQNNQTEMALLGQTVLPPEPFPFFENTRFLVLCSRGLSKWACCCPHDGQNL